MFCGNFVKIDKTVLQQNYLLSFLSYFQENLRHALFYHILVIYTTIYLTSSDQLGWLMNFKSRPKWGQMKALK